MKKEMGEVCNTYEEQQMCIQDYSGENWGKETTWKT
jgi:hypothetical protein